MEKPAGAMAGPMGVKGLDDREEGEDGKGEGGPMDELRTILLGINGEEGPSDGDGPSDITFGRRVGVGSGCGLEEEESKEYEDLGEDAGLVVRSVDTECFKSGEED